MTTLRYTIVGADQKPYGPVTAEEISRWIKEGRLNGSTRALLEGTTDWKTLADFPDFSDTLRGRATPALTPGGRMSSAEFQAWRAALLSRRPELQVGRCLVDGSKLVLHNAGLLFGATTIIWLIEAVWEKIPLLGMVYFAFKGILFGGLYVLFLKRIRGQPAQFTDVFAGFSPAFPQLMLAGLLTSLLSSLGLIFCVLPGIYLMVAWKFSVPLVADKHLEFWDAMELSRRVATRVWFELCGLLLLVFLPFILINCFVVFKLLMMIYPPIWNMVQAGNVDPGVISSLVTRVMLTSLPLWLLSKLVLLLNLPFAVGATMCAYENLFGAGATPDR